MQTVAPPDLAVVGGDGAVRCMKDGRGVLELRLGAASGTTDIVCATRTSKKIVAPEKVEHYSKDTLIGFDIQAYNGANEVIENPDLKLVSSSPAVLRVGDNNKIQCMRSGSALVNVSSGEVKKDVSVECRIVKAISIDIGDGRVEIQKNKTVAVRIVSDRGDVINAPVQWSTSNSAVATVGSDDGIVSGVGFGAVMLTASAGDVSESASVEIVRTVVDQPNGGVSFAQVETGSI